MHIECACGISRARRRSEGAHVSRARHCARESPAPSRAAFYPCSANVLLVAARRVLQRRRRMTEGVGVWEFLRQSARSVGLFPLVHHQQVSSEQSSLAVSSLSDPGKAVEGAQWVADIAKVCGSARRDASCFRSRFLANYSPHNSDPGYHRCFSETWGRIRH